MLDLNKPVEVTFVLGPMHGEIRVLQGKHVMGTFVVPVFHNEMHLMSEDTAAIPEISKTYQLVYNLQEWVTPTGNRRWLYVLHGQDPNFVKFAVEEMGL